MSKFPNQDEIIDYPVYTDVVQFYLANIGFKPLNSDEQIAITTEGTRYEKGDTKITVLHAEQMTRSQVSLLLIDAGDTLENFETFVLNNRPSGLIKRITQMAMKTPKFKK